uniref:RNA-directed DNA polymerase n=1 Tax=Meloidogyne javanica TaxID=6303 RepID=A0A915MZZ9_MELJA
MAKYQLAVQAHDIKIEHRSGRTNKFCDHLSRFPAQEEQLNEYQCKSVEENIPENQEFELPKEFYNPQKWKKVTNNEIRDELQKDRNYSEIIEKLKMENIPDNVNEQEEFLKENDKLHENFSVIDGILYKWVENNEQKIPVIVIPYALRERIVRECHEDELIGGHLGVMKTLERIRKRDPVTPIDLRLKGTDIGEREVEMSEYLENKVKIVKETWESVKESLVKAQQQQKKFADLERKEHNFEPFDLVLIQIDHYTPENSQI